MHLPDSHRVSPRNSGDLSFSAPKGPFRTKNTTTIAKIVNYYAVVFLLRPPDLLRHGPFLERENVCNFQENGVHTRCAAIVNHRAIVKILRVVNLLRVVFLVRLGPLGKEFSVNWLSVNCLLISVNCLPKRGSRCSTP